MIAKLVVASILLFIVMDLMGRIPYVGSAFALVVLTIFVHGVYALGHGRGLNGTGD